MSLIDPELLKCDQSSDTGPSLFTSSKCIHIEPSNGGNSSQEADLIRLRREAKANNGYYVEPEARLAFVVRIRGINDMHPKTKKILQLLRLRQIHNGIFIRVCLLCLPRAVIIACYCILSKGPSRQRKMGPDFRTT